MSIKFSIDINDFRRDITIDVSAEILLTLKGLVGILLDHHLAAVTDIEPTASGLSGEAATLQVEPRIGVKS